MIHRVEHPSEGSRRARRLAIGNKGLGPPSGPRKALRNGENPLEVMALLDNSGSSKKSEPADVDTQDRGARDDS